MRITPVLTAFAPAAAAVLLALPAPKAHAIFGVGDIVIDPTAAVNAASQIANQVTSLANDAISIANEAEALLNDVQRIQQEARNLASADFGSINTYLEAYEQGRDRYLQTSDRIRWFKDDAQEWFDQTYKSIADLRAAAPGETYVERQQVKEDRNQLDHDAQNDSLTVGSILEEQRQEQENRLDVASAMSRDAQGALAAMQAQTSMTREIVNAIQRLEELQRSEMRRMTTQAAGETDAMNRADAAATHFYSDARSEFTATPAELPDF